MLKKIAAAASTAALALGALTVGAGLAGAEDAPTESPSTGSLDIGKVVSDLGLAAQALNGPVSVTPNDEGGPTVTFTNRGTAAVKCVGFTMPYSTVEDLDIDPSAIDLSDLFSALKLLDAIDAEGGVSVLHADADGKPLATTPGTKENDGSAFAVARMIDGDDGVSVAPGASATWTALQPDVPAAASLICAPADHVALDALSLDFGIDKQVVADQINGKIPGGSVAPVGAGSISGGSVGVGAALTGSLGNDDTTTAPPTTDE